MPTELYNTFGQPISQAGGSIVPTTPNAPQPVQVGVLSSEQGAQKKQEQDQKLSKLSPVQLTPPADQTKKTDTATPAAEPTPTAVTLINPETGQQVTFNDASINKDQISSYTSMGYHLADASGNIPSWLQPGGVSSGSAGQENNDLQSAADELKSMRDGLTKFTVSDADLQAQIQGITALWDAREADMARVNNSREGSLNTLGYRTGMQFSGGLGGPFGGIVAEEERQGIQRISDLEGQKQSAIAAAKAAALSQNWSVYSKQVDMAEQAYQEKVKAVADLQQATMDQNKLIADTLKDQQTQYYNQVTKPINDVLSDLGKNGAPADVIAKVSQANSLAEAVAAAGGYLRNKPAIVQELDYVNGERQAAGMPAYTLDEYQTIDANRKAAATASASGLTNKQLSLIQQVNNSFDANPIVKNFIELQNKYLNTQKNVGQGDGATDIALIYDLMKTLDPTSVVRETEYATGAAKSGNIFSGALAKYNGYLNPKGGFVSETAKQNIMNVINRRFSAVKAQYDNLRSEKLKTLGSYGVDDGDSFLTQYDFQDPNSTAAGAINGGNQADPLNLGLTSSGSPTSNPLGI